MKISDRDKKIIVIVLILVVVALPYLLLIKPTNAKKEAVEGEIATLVERYNYLYELNQQRDFYINETTRYNNEREEIIKGYAEGIRQENVIMFLRGLELEIPVKMTTLTFGAHELTPIMAGTTDAQGNVTGAVNAYKTQTSVAFLCGYEDIKLFMDTIQKYDERLVLSTMDMSYDESNGLVSGLFTLDQFAITTDGRELAPAVIPSMEHGNESIFGTYISDEELLELLEELAEEAEDGEASPQD